MNKQKLFLLVCIGQIITGLYGMESKRHSSGRTPLHKAVMRGNFEEVKHLLEQKADPNCQDHTFNGATPLHFAAASKCTTILQLLIDHNANIDAHNNRQKSTPLHVAAFLGRTRIVGRLIANLANPNLTDDDELTPYKLAYTLKHYDTANTLFYSRFIKPILLDNYLRRYLHGRQIQQ